MFRDAIQRIADGETDSRTRDRRECVERLVIPSERGFVHRAVTDGVSKTSAGLTLF